MKEYCIYSFLGNKLNRVWQFYVETPYARDDTLDIIVVINTNPWSIIIIIIDEPFIIRCIILTIGWREGGKWRIGWCVRRSDSINIGIRCRLKNIFVMTRRDKGGILTSVWWLEVVVTAWSWSYNSPSSSKSTEPSSSSDDEDTSSSDTYTSITSLRHLFERRTGNTWQSTINCSKLISL